MDFSTLLTKKTSQFCFCQRGNMSSCNFFDEITVDSEGCVEKCLRHFDLDEDDALDAEEIGSLCRDLFCDRDGTPYDLPARLVPDILRCFDAAGDDKLDYDEMTTLWLKFVVPIVRPRSAVVVIDVQNDFIDGSLAVRDSPAGEEGKDVIPVINDLLQSVPFHHVFYSYDWHPENHISFIDNIDTYELDVSSAVAVDDVKVFDTVVFKGPPLTEQKLWPVHCVNDTWGSMLHPDLKVPEDALFTYKGTSPNVDSYSAFWDNQKTSETGLARDLRSRNVTDVFVCGLVFDFCVGSTALHSLELGFKTTVVEDACRSLTAEGKEAMREELLSKHSAIVTSEKVLEMVKGRDRKPELGLTLLQSLKALTVSDE